MNGYDHGDWADAKLSCGSTPPPTNQPPIAQASANPTSGTVPLAVAFSSSGSTDPDGSISAYAWDLDGDGFYDDSTSANPSYPYTAAGTYTVKLQVTDNQGAQAISNALTITATSGGGGSSTVYLSDLTPTGTPVNGWGPYEKDRSNNEQAGGDGRVLTLNGVTYAKGLGVHAASDLRFRCAVGLHDLRRAGGRGRRDGLERKRDLPCARRRSDAVHERCAHGRLGDGARIGQRQRPRAGAAGRGPEWK